MHLDQWEIKTKGFDLAPCATRTTSVHFGVNYKSSSVGMDHDSAKRNLVR